MTKDEFVYWIGWLKVRWPNAKLGEYTVKSLYQDFKIYDDRNNMNSEIYGASKAGIIQITKYFAVLLAKKI